MRPRCEPFGASSSRHFAHGQGEKPDVKNVLSLVVARPIVLTLAVGFGIALDRGSFVSGTEGGVRILVSCYILTGLYFLLARLRVRTAVHLALQIVADGLLVTGLVFMTGGSTSQYVLLYFVLILYASMYLSFRGALAAGALSAGGYSLTWWPQLLPGGAPQLGHDVSEATLKILFHGILFLTVGLLGGFLARRAEQQGRRLADTTNELHRMKLNTDVILRSMVSGLMSIDSEGKVVHFNRAASSILGIAPGLVQNRHFEEVLGPGMSAIVQLLRRGLDEGVSVLRGEVEVVSGDGRKVPLGITTSLVTTESGKRAGVIALYQDLTDVKKVEENVKRQETLAALGQFSAGIAHEIRNCLSPIIGSVELLRNELSLDSDSQRLMNLILKETDRLEGFLNELLFYARAKALDLREVNLQQLIEETVEIVRRHPAHSERKNLSCEFHAPGACLELDAEQMKRVFVNLAVNALEAIEDDGQLTIRTYLDEGGPRGNGKSNTSVTVEFDDNGVGIPPENLQSVFEPFYSTKGAGTGLGLSIAQRVVERHNGRLSIESQAGRGTKVRVHIPHVTADRMSTACLSHKAT
ncbi:MAG: ATP-binding protein [Candidatus Eisenbacteria bacterium]|nr:ATP-binding protein [Candidatus Eisenbacteria bacterium]